MGISLSVLLNPSEDKYCIIYYFNVILEEITGLIHLSFWHAPEKVVVLKSSNFVQKNKKNVGIY